MEICLRCLSKEPTQRPSVEDVLWNLQFSVQVQESWRWDSQSSENSPLSPSQPPRSPVGCFDRRHPGGNIVIHVAVGIVGSILVVGFSVFFAIRRGNLQEE
ncbi:hypothetical protein BHE74_00027163 [Ensete ventricosum]|nr:hypothetical protein BHE74_00027163 [Ensete ventricosum]